MVNRNGILSEFLRARTWVVILIAMQLVFVFPQASDEAEATTWDAPYIVASGSVLYSMAMAVEGDSVYCVYVQDNHGLYSVVMRWYDGAAWSSMLSVSPGGSTNCNYPDIAVSNGTAHITYEDHTDRDADIMYRSYNGTHFSTVLPASDIRGGVNSYDPAIAADGSHVYIVWEETTATDQDIMYRYIEGGRLGASGVLSTDIADDTQYDPAIAMADGKAHVVWADLKNGYSDIYYRTWDGASWAAEVAVSPTTDRMNQDYPDIDVEGDDVYVVYRHQNSATVYGINMVTFLNGQWGNPNGVPTPAGTEHMPRLGVEAGHVALVYLNSGTFFSAYFLLHDGQSWGMPEALETGDASHTYWPTDVALVNGRAHVMILDDTSSSRVHRYYVADIDEQDPSADVGEISPYWMAIDRISLPYSASDDYGLASVTFQYRYSTDNATWDRWTVVLTLAATGLSTTGTVSFTPADGDGFYEFKAYAIDIAGKSEAPSIEPEAMAALDTVDPTGSIAINLMDAYAVNSTVTLYLTYDDATSGVLGVRFADEAVGGDEPWDNPVDTKEWQLPATEGEHTVAYQVMDVSGRVSRVYTDSIDLDLADPEGTITINGGADWATSSDVSLDLTSTDTGSGTVKVRIGDDHIGGDEPWEDPVETREWTLPAGEGEHTVAYQVIDAAGRLSEVYLASIGLDTVAPTGSILVEGSDTFTTTRTVTLTLTADDATSGVAGIRVTNEAVGGDEPWDNKVDTLEWELTEGSGAKTVRYQVIDVAGLVSEVYSASITLDTDKPTGTIALASGATLVNTATVTLTLSFEDETSSIVGIRIQEEAVGGDEPWDNPVEALEFQLSAGDGVKTIYFQVLDEAGQESQVYSVSFTLDTANPFVDSIDPAELADQVPVDKFITVRFSEAMDAATVEAAFALSYVEDGTTVEVEGTFEWSGDGRTVTFTPDADLKAGTDYTLAVSTEAADVAGNGLFPASSTGFVTVKSSGGDGDGDGDGDDGAGNLWLIVAVVAVVALVIVAAIFIVLRGRA